MKNNYPLIAGISVFLFSGADAQTNTVSGYRREEALTSFAAGMAGRAQRQRAEVGRLTAQGYREIIYAGSNTKQLVGSDEQGRPMYYTTMNAGAAKMTKASEVYSGSAQIPGITGAGMVIGQWDFSSPRLTHELLAGKVTYGSSQNQTVSRHSTNIAGTMVGSNGDPLARGIAFGAAMHAYDWIDDVSEMGAEAYDPAANPGGIVVANNSYGFDPMYLQEYQFGKYNATSQSWDQLMFLKPYLQIVKAAGNARESDPAVVPQVAAKGGYDLLEGAGISKNVIVVASAKKNPSMSTDEDYSVSDFSSYGPTDDGRIKPDFCAPGEDMYSSVETYDQAYGTYRGTSSATAVTSGIVALLQGYWKSLHAGGYMLSSTVRALLAHTANDRGTYGPDYIYGWGLLDAQRAVSAVYNNIEGSTDKEKKTTLIKEAVLSQGNRYVLYVVPYDMSQPLSATLAWTDPQGALPDGTPDSDTRSLVNDLDIKIERADTGQTFFPWKLGGMRDRTSAATRSGTNDVDNIERVDIDPAELSKTTYKITISTKSKAAALLPDGRQAFSLVASNVDFCYMDDLAVLGSTAQDIYSATTVKAKKIQASNTVYAQAQGVEYIASESVSLIPGFHAEYGAGFHAYITPCFDTVSPMKYTAQRRESTSAGLPEPAAEADSGPNGLALYPNPAVGECNVSFRLESESAISISVYDGSGRKVLSWAGNAPFPKGRFLKTIDTSGLPAGLYLVEMDAGAKKEVKKLIVKK